MNLNKNGMEKRWRYAREAREREGRQLERGKEREKEKESEGMRKMQYILGVVERVGGYGALSFCSHEKTGYSRCMVDLHDWHISNRGMLMTI